MRPREAKMHPQFWDVILWWSFKGILFIPSPAKTRSQPHPVGLPQFSEDDRNVVARTF